MSDGIPPCVASMGCLCAGHARGNHYTAACDTSEVDLRSGRIVVRLDCGQFKLGIVLGDSRKPGKKRIRTWSNATRSWTAPFAIEARWLGTVDADLAKHAHPEAVRRRGVVNRALEASIRAGAGRRGWL